MNEEEFVKRLENVEAAIKELEAMAELHNKAAEHYAKIMKLLKPMIQKQTADQVEKATEPLDEKYTEVY